MLTEEGLMHVPGMHSRWVRLASGARAHYMTSGETGPAVVLMHGGFPGSSGTAGWRNMAPALGAAGFRVYCPDFPGFGLADTREEYLPSGPASHIDFLHEFTTALCLDKFHLSGNSMGGSNTVHYALAHPERVLSCIIIATSYLGDILPSDFDGDQKKFATFDGSIESMRAILGTITANDGGVSEELAQMRLAAAQRNLDSHQRFKDGQADLYGSNPDPVTSIRMATKGRIDRLPLPTLYIYPAKDALAPVEVGQAQEDILPNIQFFYPAKAGHQAQNDDPELFNQLYLEFFRDGKVSWETATRAGISDRREPNWELVAKAES